MAGRPFYPSYATKGSSHTIPNDQNTRMTAVALVLLVRERPRKPPEDQSAASRSMTEQAVTAQTKNAAAAHNSRASVWPPGIRSTLAARPSRRRGPRPSAGSRSLVGREPERTFHAHRGSPRPPRARTRRAPRTSGAEPEAVADRQGGHEEQHEKPPEGSRDRVDAPTRRTSRNESYGEPGARRAGEGDGAHRELRPRCPRLYSSAVSYTTSMSRPRCHRGDGEHQQAQTVLCSPRRARPPSSRARPQRHHDRGDHAADQDVLHRVRVVQRPFDQAERRRVRHRNRPNEPPGPPGRPVAGEPPADRQVRERRRTAVQGMPGRAACSARAGQGMELAGQPGSKDGDHRPS